jgi:hypothetical protein
MSEPVRESVSARVSESGGRPLAGSVACRRARRGRRRGDSSGVLPRGERRAAVGMGVRAGVRAGVAPAALGRIGRH